MGAALTADKEAKRFLSRCVLLGRFFLLAAFLIPALDIVFWIVVPYLPPQTLESTVRAAAPFLKNPLYRLIALGISVLPIVPTALGLVNFSRFFTAIAEDPVFPERSVSFLRRVARYALYLLIGQWLAKTAYMTFYSFIDDIPGKKLSIMFSSNDLIMFLCAVVFALFAWLFKQASAYEQENKLTV